MGRSHVFFTNIQLLDYITCFNYDLDIAIKLHKNIPKHYPYNYSSPCRILILTDPYIQTNTRKYSRNNDFLIK